MNESFWLFLVAEGRGGKGGGRGGKLKRGASCFKSGNVANQKKVVRNPIGRSKGMENQ